MTVVVEDAGDVINGSKNNSDNLSDMLVYSRSAYPGDKPHVTIYDPYSKHVQAIFSKSPCFIKTNNIQFPPHIHPEASFSRGYRKRKKKKKPRFPHLCGLMQNILCFFSRERAKFVPMVSVAGNAGGTTMVIKSRALTIIRRQESYKTKVLAK